MEIEKSHIVGIVLGLVIIVSSLFLTGTKVYFLLIGTGFLVIAAPFVFGIMREARMDLEKEEMFFRIL